MKDHIKYSEGYKYQLREDYSQLVGIYPPQDIVEKFIILTRAGVLTVLAGYCWDGASGPTIDTASSMRGALCHDACYQLMRDNKLCYTWKTKADEILRDTCIADGMWQWRARRWFAAVQAFAGFAIHTPVEILTAP